MSHKGWDYPLTEKDFHALCERLDACPSCQTANYMHWGFESPTPHLHVPFAKHRFVFTCYGCDRIHFFRREFLDEALDVESRRSGS